MRKLGVWYADIQWNDLWRGAQIRARSLAH